MAWRMLTALVGVPILIGVIWLGSPWLPIFVVVVALLGLWEFYQIGKGPRAPLYLAFGGVWTLTLVISGQVGHRWSDYIPHLALSAGLVIALAWLALNHKKEGVVARWSYSVIGPVLLGFTLAHALMLRELDDIADPGRDWLLLALLVTFATDTGAYLTGRSIGAHKMAPSISPNKTWEGAIGGLLWAVAVAAALGSLIELSVPLWQLAMIGSIVGVVAQLGDLAESSLKRYVGVKDTGTILPGHGGALDRLDSIVFVLPVVYYLVALAL